MRGLYDDKVKGEEYYFYLIFDFIKVDTLENAQKKQKRLMKHDFNFWDKEDKGIYFVVSKVEKIYSDGSYVYEDIKKERIENIG